MTSQSLILKLRLSEPRTEEREFSLWQTPVVEDAANRKLRVNSRGEPKLSGQVKLYPTPRAHEVGDYQYDRGNHSKKRLTLTAIAKLYPTPRAQSWTGASDAPNRHGSPDLQSTVGGALNPTWVEWLMGFPIGWTELKPSETR